MIKEKIRYIFHELYYKLTPPGGVEFAMTCKQATELIDLRKRPGSFRDRFRLWLHLRICQACNYYFKASRALRRAVIEMLKNTEEKIDLKGLNQELLKKHSRNNEEK